MASKTNWPMDNFKKGLGAAHFLALVTYMSKIDDLSVTPEIYVVPANRISRYFYRNPKGTRQVVPYRAISKHDEYLDAWELLR